jgi:two-component system nitrogen regulation response regulator NtrX
VNRILIVDDEINLRRSLQTTFEMDGWSVETALHGKAALEMLDRVLPDVMLVDLQMPVMGGLELLEALAGREGAPPVIVLTAHGSIDTALQATRAGAVDFLEKPPHAEKVLLAARNACERHRLSVENVELKRRLEGDRRMIGEATAMQALREAIERVAPTRARVLIRGEHGTGKELVAEALHAASPRAGRPFIRVNCAAVPPELFESELFGHKKGAFTGASGDRLGKFRRADGGTLFLDEIGELPRALQPKLLRVLESGDVEPVGGDSEVKVDVRLIAATNRDLEAAIEDGSFRADLYYRLETVSLTVPPLRERKQDLPALVRHFVAQARVEHGLPARSFTEDAMQRLARHDFPGNVRELRNRIERWLILAPDGPLDRAVVEADLQPVSGAAAVEESEGSLRDRVRAFERRTIEETLEIAAGNVAEAARRLGLERSHLYKKMRALEMNRDDG